MELVISSLAGWGISKVADTLWNGAGNQLNNALKKTDVEKAIAAGDTAARKWEESQQPEDRLFFSVDRDGPQGVSRFLDLVFNDSGVQEELQQPLKNEGKPQVPFLEAAFQRVAFDSGVKLNQRSLKPWIEQFVNTYFEKTSTYLRFQIAKEDYFEQLANWFDDLKFAGIAVPGQEIEKSAKLARIFVMPDVVEEGQSRSDRWLEQELLSAETGDRQVELLREQRQLAQLESRSGRKFKAQKLLSQSQSKKVVLLGAPGSGKTTLMSYFAVMLAKKHPAELGLATDTDWLSILIKIRDLARQPDISILDYARQFAEKTMSVKKLPEGFFEYWLEDGRALILLDGLDEVAEEAKRYDVEAD